MTTFISDSVLREMTAARLAALKKTSRLRVQVDRESYPVLRMWRGERCGAKVRRSSITQAR